VTWAERMRGDEAPSTTSDRATLRDRAGQLEADGRFGEAVSAWTALNRAASDPDVERHLVALRHAAAADLRDASSADWPPCYDDPFPNARGAPPEVAAGELTARHIGGAIRHHGCLLVRNLLDAGRAETLVQTIDAAFDAREAHHDGAPLDATSPWFAPDPVYDEVGPQAVVQRTLNRNLKSVLAVDSPRALFEIVDALAARGVPDILAEYFGETPVLTVEKTTLRRVQPGPAPAWHQDGSFLTGGVRTVDVWIALSRCGGGTDSSGLEVLPRRLDGVLDCGAESARTGIEILAEDVARAGAGVETVCPTFEAGDALLFDELFLHRTMPGLARPRYALEVWTFAASRCADGYTPVLL
jgi:hypothetical protein